ncbi:PAS domain-containing sensor histidine kinase [Pseudazoarcus pumilus]|uniref:histidine kinase n=1 Tax=Pseudazoarcus pumilus TaxID=2067960 RepID=A0A2I6S8G3_9RHOO|nr:PAS domain-containing sensor histidine kinase [Pseudazoarcus pumilus]
MLARKAAFFAACLPVTIDERVIRLSAVKEPATPAAPQLPDGQRLDAAQLAEAFTLFARASEELSGAYNALQAQAAQLTERMNVLMGALPAGVVVLDSERRIVQCNRAARGLLGAGCEGEAWRSVQARFVATSTPGEVSLGEGAEARRLALSEAAVESGEEHIVLIHDVTDAHRMRLAAERNERLAAMGEMVAGLAHQLRTPLSAALLYTAGLAKPELPPADRERVAERAIERLRHLERLIGDMLRFARGDQLGRQSFGVCELLRELAHTLEPVARARRVRFVSRCDCDDYEVFGDRKALGGALTNLMENAIQISHEGGEVRVDVSLEGDELVCVVADDGPGIARAEQARVFEPFFTTRTDGTGLGLAIARDVARAHGGDVALASQPGRGATFTLTLPVHPPAGDAVPPTGDLFPHE